MAALEAEYAAAVALPYPSRPCIEETFTILPSFIKDKACLVTITQLKKLFRNRLSNDSIFIGLSLLLKIPALLTSMSKRENSCFIFSHISDTSFSLDTSA